MACTFPGVLCYQALTAPVVGAILLGSYLLSKTLEVKAVSFAGALLALCLMAGMSFLGFFEGWRIGWRFAKGRSWSDAIYQGTTGRLLKVLESRLPKKRPADGS
jgi:hypothetical protein